MRLPLTVFHRCLLSAGASDAGEVAPKGKKKSGEVNAAPTAGGPATSAGDDNGGNTPKEKAPKKKKKKPVVP